MPSPDLADIPVGIAGPGAIGGFHARAIAELGGRVVAVAGPRPEENAEFAAAYSVPRTYGSLDDMLADDEVAAVVIASPSPVHAEQATAAMRAGKAVLCEIPMGLSLADAETVVRVAAETSACATVAHTLRFWEPHRRVRALVESGELRLTHVIARSLQLRQTNVGWTGRVRDWTDNVLWHHGAHQVDAALWFLDATDVQVHGGRGPDWPKTGSPMDVAAVLATPHGGLATLCLSYHSRAAVDDYVLIAEDTTLRIGDGRLLGPDGPLVDSPDTATTQSKAIAAQDEEFLTAVGEGRSPVFTVADALPAMRVLGALQVGTAGTASG